MVKRMHTRLHFETPVIESTEMAALTSKRIWLKMECYQPVGSFKIRGMGHLCAKIVEEGAKHLFSSSGGNAGYAVAYAGRKLGVPVTIVVPTTTSEEVCRTIESEGAQILHHGDVWDEAHNKALRLSKNHLGGYVHPFDDPAIWQGHATMIDECVQQCGKPDIIVVSVGGGGLFCGVMEGLKRNPQWHSVPVVTVETVGASSLASSVEADKLVVLDKITSIATTLGAKKVAERAFELAKTEQVTCVIVTDEDAVAACLHFANDHRTLVEPACGAALAVVYNNLSAIDSATSVLVIVCGGIGVNPAKLRDWAVSLGLA